MQERKASLIQEMRSPEDKRRQSGGRRISDRIKPLLSQLLSVIASDNIHEGFFNLADEIKDSFDCQSLVIYSVNEDQTQLFSRNFISEEIDEKRVDISPANLPGYVFTSKEALNINDAYDKNDLARFPGLSHDPRWDEKNNIKTQTAIVIPVVHDEETIGVLEIINKMDQAPFSDQHLKLAQNFSVYLGKALFKLNQEENKEKLLKTSLAIQKAGAADDFNEEIAQPLMKLFRADVVLVYSIIRSRNEVHSKFRFNEVFHEISLPISNRSIVGWAALEKRVVNVSDLSDKDILSQYHPDLRFNDSLARKLNLNIQSMLCCPMIHENELVGVVQLIHTRLGKVFHKKNEKNIIALAPMLGIAYHQHVKLQEVQPHIFGHLVQSGLLAPEELQEALKQARKDKLDAGTLLLDRYGISKGDLGKSLEKFYGVSYFGFNDSRILPPAFLEGLDIKHLAKNHWVPVQRNEDLVVILVDDPSDKDKIASIKSAFPKKEVQFRVGLKADILDFLQTSPAGNSESDP